MAREESASAGRCARQVSRLLQLCEGRTLPHKCVPMAPGTGPRSLFRGYISRSDELASKKLAELELYTDASAARELSLSPKIR